MDNLEDRVELLEIKINCFADVLERLSSAVRDLEFKLKKHEHEEFTLVFKQEPIMRIRG